MSNPKAGGFTLIELAIVIAIIGILALAAVFNFQNNIRAAEIGKARAILSQLNSGAAMSIALNLQEPTTFGAYVGTDATDTIQINDARCVDGGAAELVCTFDQITATYTLANGSVTMAQADN